MTNIPNVDVAESPKRLRLAPEDRRKHILDAAQRLFFARGWDDVTIADVLDEAGISKGGFYHHFAAKEDLLDGLVARLTEQALAAAEASRAATSGDSLTRLNVFLAETSRWKAEQAAQLKFFVEVMVRPGNDTLFGRITAGSNAAVMPVLLDMIAQGVKEGLFDVPDPTLAAETILAMAQGRRVILQDALETARAGDLTRATDLLHQRMLAEGALLDRMLGLPNGSVLLSNPTEYHLMLSAIVAT